MWAKIVGVIVVMMSVGVYHLAQNDLFSDELLKEALHDKVVVICGASSGIGEATAYKYAAAGSKLILSARSLDKLQVVKEAALERGAQAVDIVVQDFSEIEELTKYRERVLEIHPTIDVLMLNHAAMPMAPWTSFASFKQSPEFTLRTFNINVLSFIELTRVFMGELEATGGQIHVTSSSSGFVPHFGFGLYTSTKHAINGFFFSLQQELIAKQSSVSVSVFSLGLIMTQNVETLFSSEPQTQFIPTFYKGNVNHVADIIVSATISRPRNVDYPILPLKLKRGLVYFLPNFHDIVIGASGDYNEFVTVQRNMEKVSKKINYQVGNI